MRIIICLSLMVAVALGASTRDHNCESLSPLAQPTATQGRSAAPITVSMTPSKLVYAPGEKITVSFSTTDPMTTFALQARKIFTAIPSGTWEIDSPELKLYQCSNKDDTVGNYGYNPTKEVEAVWVAPATTADQGAYEFKIGFANPENEHWNFTSPFVHIMPEGEVVPENPEEIDPTASKPDTEPEADKDENEDDPHDAKREEEQALQWKIKMEQMTQQENDESEKDWTRQEEVEREEHEKEIHDEMMMYEEKLAQEEQERQDRIRAEIVDKEEWEREQIKKKEEEGKFRPGGNEVGYGKNTGLVVDGSGASSVVASIAVVFLSLALLRL